MVKKYSIVNQLKGIIRKHGQGVLKRIYPQLVYLNDPNLSWELIKSIISESDIDRTVKLYKPYHIYQSNIGAYSYVGQNSFISISSIAKFCSIGPNFMCGWGIHPTDGISTSPMFYSTLKQNGFSLSLVNKIKERREIQVGNDVFIGANVTVLDGIKIGDGAIIGAGAVVSKDIPPYSIAVGAPIKIIRYRFNDYQISKLLKIKWWDFDEDKLKDVEKMFFEIDKFIEKYGS